MTALLYGIPRGYRPVWSAQPPTIGLSETGTGNLLAEPFRREEPVSTPTLAGLIEEYRRNVQEYERNVATMAEDFESVAQRYAEQHGVTLERAYRDVARENPALWEAHRVATYLE